VVKERVTVRLGNVPVVIVAPHGHQLDDSNTDILSEALADHLDAHAVINRGWRRNPAVDEVKSLANCNDYRHCQEPVVKQEFLDPINQIISDYAELGEHTLVLMIHGMGNQIRQTAKEPKLGVVVGYGNGKPPRHTCELWRKDALVDLLNDSGVVTYEGAAGGAFSARGSNNMTQVLHANSYGSTSVLQVEVVYDLRRNQKEAEYIGSVIGVAVETLLAIDSYKRPKSVLVGEV